MPLFIIYCILVVIVTICTAAIPPRKLWAFTLGAFGLGLLCFAADVELALVLVGLAMITGPAATLNALTA